MPSYYRLYSIETVPRHKVEENTMNWYQV